MPLVICRPLSESVASQFDPFYPQSSDYASRISYYPCKWSQGNTNLGGAAGIYTNGAGTNNGQYFVTHHFELVEPAELCTAMVDASTNSLNWGDRWRIYATNDTTYWTHIWEHYHSQNADPFEISFGRSGAFKYWRFGFLRSKTNNSTSCGVGQFGFTNSFYTKGTEEYTKQYAYLGLDTVYQQDNESVTTEQSLYQRQLYAFGFTINSTGGPTGGPCWETTDTTNWGRGCVQQSHDLSFRTGDFTIDFWAKIPDDGSRAILEQRWSPTVTVDSWYMGVYGSPLRIRWWSEGSDTIVQSLPADTWTHVAWVRESGVLKLYLNGIFQASAQDATDYRNQMLWFGQNNYWRSSPIYRFRGSLASLRIRKSAAWTTNFTPPDPS